VYVCSFFPNRISVISLEYPFQYQFLFQTSFPYTLKSIKDSHFIKAVPVRCVAAIMQKKKKNPQHLTSYLLLSMDLNTLYYYPDYMLSGDLILLT
jgi:hypothetical protein